MNEIDAEHIAAVKRLLQERQSAADSTFSDDEVLFLAELGEWIDLGKITFDVDWERAFDLVGDHYPIAASRIAWPAIRDHKRLNIRSEFPAGSVHCDDLAAAMAGKRGIIQGWFSESGIAMHTKVAVAGDVYNLLLTMNVETLLECYPILFVHPQHTYALPADGSWCFMGTVEGQIYFGIASNAMTTGPVELEAYLNFPNSSAEAD